MGVGGGSAVVAGGRPRRWGWTLVRGWAVVVGVEVGEGGGRRRKCRGVGVGWGARGGRWVVGGGVGEDEGSRER